VASLAPVWEAPLDEGPAGGPVVSAHGVHVAGPRSVYGFGAVDGARLWEHEVAAPLAVQQPLVVGDQVLASRWNPTATEATDPSGSDAVERLDAGTGAVEGRLDDAVALSVRGREALTWGVGFIRLGRPLFPFWGEELLVRDLDTGALRCCNGTFYGLAGGGNDATPPPPERITFGRRWLVQAGSGQLDPEQPGIPANGVRGYWIDETSVCLGLYTCADWALPLDGTTATTPVLSEDQVTAYVGTDAGTVHAVDLGASTPASAPTIEWSVPVGSAVTASPALAGDWVFVPTAAGDLVVLNAATGVERWRASAGPGLDRQPAVGGGVVFTGATDGTVRAFGAEGCPLRPGDRDHPPTCEPLWSASVGAAVTGAPAVAGGQLYVGTADGRVVAFGLP
jgi:outer membrane protein assembly factor BamB